MCNDRLPCKPCKTMFRATRGAAMRRGSASRSTALTYKLHYALRRARRVGPRYVGAATAMGCRYVRIGDAQRRAPTHLRLCVGRRVTMRRDAWRQASERAHDVVGRQVERCLVLDSSASDAIVVNTRYSMLIFHLYVLCVNKMTALCFHANIFGLYSQLQANTQIHALFQE